MPKLETQINQIYLSAPQGKKTSIILHEEPLSNSSSLYLIAQLKDLKNKNEKLELKKISEIILRSFKGNKKLSGETLFETALSQINQNLADLAHEGHKSWVGKFSCLIALKNSENIYLTSSGQTVCYLLRKNELTEILPPEKLGTHPLKSFINFTAGKLAENDTLVLTTSNIFNYISFELFSKLLSDKTPAYACEEISKILKDSLSEDEAFASFFLNFSKTPAEEACPTEEIYAPLPEDIQPSFPVKFKLKMPSLPAVNLKFSRINPVRSLRRALNAVFANLFMRSSAQQAVRYSASNGVNLGQLKGPKKFFFASFGIFLLLFVITLASAGFKQRAKNANAKIEELAGVVENGIADTRSLLIYKNDNDAVVKLAQTQADFENLRKLSPEKSDSLSNELELLKNEVNKVNFVAEPKVFVDLKHHPVFLAKSATGFLFSNQDSNSISYHDKILKDYFMLNSLKSPITGIGYYSPVGVIILTNNQIFRIDNNLKQFEHVLTIDNANLVSIKPYGSFLYALDQNDQVVKISYAKNKYQTSVSARGEFNDARDFGIDKDIYVLFPDKIVKFVAGKPQAFAMPNMSEPITNATRIQATSNLYILESNKKRLLIISKAGALINQIIFPNTSNPSDFFVDEAGRSIYLLDDNKLYKITF